MKQRAMADIDKEQRRQTLLDGARALYLANTRQLPTVAAIAEQCGLAKGTVYLYFKSKEEIFIALLGAEFETLFERIGAALAGTAGAPLATRSFAQTYSRYLTEHPEFLRLAAMASSVLEQAVALEVVVAFKTQLAQALSAAGQQLEAVTGLALGEGSPLLLRTYALSLGLWQASDVPPALEVVLADPALSLLRPDFAKDLPLAIEQLWNGALLAKHLSE